MLSAQLQDELLKRLVGRTQNVDEAQGADQLLFRSFEAWSAIWALHQSQARVQGILGRALLEGHAYILVSNLGKLIDKRNDQPNSLKNIWHKFCEHTQATSAEKAKIKKSFEHPESCPDLAGLHSLRNKVFAHNSLTRLTIESDDVERALYICFRSWFLLSELLTNYPILFPFRSFETENWKLNQILPDAQFKQFRAAWSKCQERAKNWQSTPIL